MNIAFTGADLVRFGMIIYVAIWFVFLCYLHIYSRKKSPNVHKIAMWYTITVATRHWGWIIGIVVGLLLCWILPDVYVVTQDPERKEAEIKENMEKWEWYTNTTYTPKETFYVDKYYVPFIYHTRYYKPFSSYLLNETDSTLAIYTTELFNGLFTKVSDVEDFEMIVPGHFQKFDRYIHNEFNAPKESYGTVPKDRKNKSKTELTITLMSEAIHDTEIIREKIETGNIMMFGWDEKDSLVIPVNARNTVLKQLKLLQDAE